MAWGNPRSKKESGHEGSSGLGVMSGTGSRARSPSNFLKKEKKKTTLANEWGSFESYQYPQ